MNNYAVVQCVNGTFSVVSEHGDNLQQARYAFHNRCAILWSASDVITGYVAILASDLTYVDGRIEKITHEPENTESEVSENEENA
jgi:hypothetical protein